MYIALVQLEFYSHEYSYLHMLYYHIMQRIGYITAFSSNQLWHLQGLLQLNIARLCPIIQYIIIRILRFFG